MCEATPAWQVRCDVTVMPVRVRAVCEYATWRVDCMGRKSVCLLADADECEKKRGGSNSQAVLKSKGSYCSENQVIEPDQSDDHP